MPNQFRLEICPGEHIEEIAQRAARFAESVDASMTFCFNDIEIAVMPGATPQAVMDVYYEQKAKTE